MREGIRAVRPVTACFLNYVRTCARPARSAPSLPDTPTSFCLSLAAEPRQPIPLHAPLCNSDTSPPPPAKGQCSSQSPSRLAGPSRVGCVCEVNAMHQSSSYSCGGGSCLGKFNARPVWAMTGGGVGWGLVQVNSTRQPSSPAAHAGGAGGGRGGRAAQGRVDPPSQSRDGAPPPRRQPSSHLIFFFFGGLSGVGRAAQGRADPPSQSGMAASHPQPLTLGGGLVGGRAGSARTGRPSGTTSRCTPCSTPTASAPSSPPCSTTPRGSWSAAPPPPTPPRRRPVCATMA